VLVSDAGYRGVVLLNRTRALRFDEHAAPPFVWAESGANLGRLARQAAARGLAGLEWAAGIPGTVGGAVFGNAGAHGDDTASCLLLAEILHPGNRRLEYTPEQLEFAYRSSLLKAGRPGKPAGQSEAPSAIILAASLRLELSTSERVRTKINEFVEHRRRTQPPGASMGSMFKNPPGDYAGRLIEAAGLKGIRQGSAQISPLHANFFINLGGAGAGDVYRLIRMARAAVQEHSGVELELEIELIGDWNI
jgi:UDP-N-acetylmuramate dehydrogenase